MQPFHGLAYITNPQFLLEVKSLSAEEDENVFQWVRTKHPNFSSGIMSFTIKNLDIYPPLMFSPEIANKMTPHKWWCAKKKKLEDRNASADLKEITDFLQKLHSCPASSAALERIFSTYRYILYMVQTPE